MVSKRVTNTPKSRREPPATTPEGRENQLVAKAVALAERQIEEGTASSQVITHYLKLGSSRELLEQERLRNENLMMLARIEGLASQKNVERLYEQALTAMRSYKGDEPLPPPDFEVE